MNNFKKGQLADGDIAQWLLALKAKAYTPESNFTVAAVFRARLGHIDDYYFGGVNVENNDHRLTTHAEEGCISAMITTLGRNAVIAEAWVLGASCCGKCRQQIAGFAAPGVEVHYLSPDGKPAATTTVGAFLPDLFTFSSYLPETKKTTLSDLPTDYELLKPRLIRQQVQPEKDIFNWLKSLSSVDDVSQVSQSMIIRLDNGAYAAGTKIEDAAFCSINAAQSAVANAVCEFGMRPVQEAWIYTKAQGKAAIPRDSFGALPMSALQTLLQVAANGQIPLHFIAGDNTVVDTTLTNAATIAPTSGHPFCKKPS